VWRVLFTSQSGNPPLRTSPWAHGPMRTTRYMPCFAHSLRKRAQIALSRPVELALDFLMVNPDDVGGDNVDPGRLHLEDLFVPARRRVAREVELPHHREPRLAVQAEETAVQADDIAGTRPRRSPRRSAQAPALRAGVAASMTIGAGDLLPESWALRPQGTRQPAGQGKKRCCVCSERKRLDRSGRSHRLGTATPAFWPIALPVPHRHDGKIQCTRSLPLKLHPTKVRLNPIRRRLSSIVELLSYTERRHA
jgi:hypothetical protein